MTDNVITDGVVVDDGIEECQSDPMVITPDRDTILEILDRYDDENFCQIKKDIIKVLDAEITMDYVDENGKTLLMRIIDVFNTPDVRYFLHAYLDTVVDIDRVDKDGGTLLIFALGRYEKHESIEVVKKLIEMSDVNIADRNGCPPLMFAIEHFKKHMCMGLITILIAESNDDIVSNVLKYAIVDFDTHRSIDIVKLMIMNTEIKQSIVKTLHDAFTDEIYYSDVDTKSHMAGLFVEIIPMLEERGVDLNAVDSNGIALIIKSIWLQSPSLTQAFIDAGVDLNIESSKPTPLYYAVRRYYADIGRENGMTPEEFVDLFLKRQLDTSIIIDDDGNTLMHFILSEIISGRVKPYVVLTLKKYNSFICTDIKNHQLQTPLDLIEEMDDKDLSRRLAREF